MSEKETEQLLKIHDTAEALVLKWWPDTAKYPREKRTAEIAIMDMLVQIETGRYKFSIPDSLKKAIEDYKS